MSSVLYLKDCLGGSVVKNRLPMQETQETQGTRVQSLGQEDPLEKEMATHSSILAWKKIPWREEPDGLQSMGTQRVRHNLAIEHAAFYVYKGISIPKVM